MKEHVINLLKQLSERYETIKNKNYCFEMHRLFTKSNLSRKVRSCLLLKLMLHGGKLIRSNQNPKAI